MVSTTREMPEGMQPLVDSISNAALEVIMHKMMINKHMNPTRYDLVPSILVYMQTDYAIQAGKLRKDPMVTVDIFQSMIDGLIITRNKYKDELDAGRNEILS